MVAGSEILFLRALFSSIIVANFTGAALSFL